MIRILLIVVFACAITGAASGQEQDLQPPSPGASEESAPEQTHSQNSNDQREADQKRAPERPIIVNVSPPRKTEAEAEEDRRERNEKSELDRRLVELTGNLALFTAGLFIATVVLAFATAALFWATRRLVRGAEETAERQLRAYVSATPKYIFAFDKNSYCVMRIEFHNHGVTPAYDSRQRMGLEILPYPLPPNYNFEPLLAPLPGGVIIHPRTFTTSERIASRVFSEEEIQ